MKWYKFGKAMSVWYKFGKAMNDTSSIKAWMYDTER